ncbi:MAG: PAS domain S-box protein [Candidatus Manganitrophus sp.]|nr:MAG: PAS domain S-box protein [Candidatus Manganitrophus sp.]
MLKRLAQGKMARLLEELKTQQAKLEMQNEELRETQTRLEKFAYRYSNLYHGAPVGDFIFDCDGTILEVNPAGAEQLGEERHQIIDQPFTRYLSQEDQIRFRTHLAAVFQDGYRRRCEIKIKRGDRLFDSQMESLLVEGERGIRHCRTVIIDIPSRKKAEEGIKRLNKSLESQILLQTAELRAMNQALENEIMERMKAEQTVALKGNVDAATGLYSRRYFDLRADEEIARVDRKGGVLQSSSVI